MGYRDVVLVAGVGFPEAAIKIVDDVAGAPIELRGYRRHVGSGECGHHQAAKRRWKMIDHHANVARFGVLEIRIKNH